MKEIQAVKIYLKTTPTARKTVRKIMDWDKSKNIQINAKKIGLSEWGAYMFKRRFGLSCKSLKG